MKNKFLNNNLLYFLFILIVYIVMVNLQIYLGFMLNMHLYDNPKDKISNMIGLGSRFILNTPIFGYHFKFWGI